MALLAGGVVEFLRRFKWLVKQSVATRALRALHSR
jgi:hypothetical protein